MPAYRELLLKNTSGETAPAFGVAEVADAAPLTEAVEGGTADGESYIEIQKPTGDADARLVAIGPVDIADGGFGQGFSGDCFVRFAGSDPANGDILKSKNAQWSLESDGGGVSVKVDGDVRTVGTGSPFKVCRVELGAGGSSEDRLFTLSTNDTTPATLAEKYTGPTTASQPADTNEVYLRIDNDGGAETFTLYATDTDTSGEGSETPHAIATFNTAYSGGTISASEWDDWYTIAGSESEPATSTNPNTITYAAGDKALFRYTGSVWALIDSWAPGADANHGFCKATSSFSSGTANVTPTGYRATEGSDSPDDMTASLSNANALSGTTDDLLAVALIAGTWTIVHVIPANTDRTFTLSTNDTTPATLAEKYSGPTTASQPANTNEVYLRIDNDGSNETFTFYATDTDTTDPAEPKAIATMTADYTGGAISDSEWTGWFNLEGSEAEPSSAGNPNSVEYATGDKALFRDDGGGWDLVDSWAPNADADHGFCTPYATFDSGDSTVRPVGYLATEGSDEPDDMTESLSNSNGLEATSTNDILAVAKIDGTWTIVRVIQQITNTDRLFALSSNDTTPGDLTAKWAGSIVTGQPANTNEVTLRIFDDGANESFVFYATDTTGGGSSLRSAIAELGAALASTDGSATLSGARLTGPGTLGSPPAAAANTYNERGTAGEYCLIRETSTDAWEVVAVLRSGFWPCWITSAAAAAAESGGDITCTTATVYLDTLGASAGLRAAGTVPLTAYWDDPEDEITVATGKARRGVCVFTGLGTLDILWAHCKERDFTP